MMPVRAVHRNLRYMQNVELFDPIHLSWAGLNPVQKKMLKPSISITKYLNDDNFFIDLQPLTLRKGKVK